MSPSPGTARSGVHRLPITKSLTCTWAIVSPAAATVAPKPRSAKHEPISMHTPVPWRRARSTASRSVVTKLRSSRSELVFSSTIRTPCSLACSRTGSSAAPSESAASSQVSVPAGPLVMTMQDAPVVTATATARTRRSCCAGHVDTSSRRHHPSSTRLLTRKPASRTRAAEPGSPPSSSLRYESPTWSIPVAVQNRRSSSSDHRHDETALTDSRGCSALPEVDVGGGDVRHRHPAGHAAVDGDERTGDEPRLVRREEERGVRDVVGHAEPCQVHGPGRAADGRVVHHLERALAREDHPRDDAVAPHIVGGVFDRDR